MFKLLRNLQNNRGTNMLLNSDNSGSQKQLSHGSNENFNWDNSSSRYFGNNGSAYQYQQGKSPAETTMSRYNDNGNGNCNVSQNSTNMETRLCKETGVQHPYNKLRDYLSRFPLRFKGYYACGSKDHFSTRY